MQVIGRKGTEVVFDILNYTKSCPYLSDFNYNVDFLGKGPYSMSVNGRQDTEVVKSYTDGDALVKDTFLLKVRLPYGMDMNKNLDNCRLMENVSKWFADNSARGILPELSGGIAVSAGAEFSHENVVYTADTVVYTAKIAILYYKAKSL